MRERDVFFFLIIKRRRREAFNRFSVAGSAVVGRRVDAGHEDDDDKLKCNLTFYMGGLVNALAVRATGIGACTCVTMARPLSLIYIRPIFQPFVFG